MSRAVAETLAGAADLLDDPDIKRRGEFETGIADLQRFVHTLARTADEHDMEADAEGKPFPDWPYLDFLLDVYQGNRLLLVEKARQLMVTWLFAAVITWEVRHPSRRWGWVSLKEDHADAALERIWFIVEHLGGTRFASGNGSRKFRDIGGVMWERSYTKIRLPELNSFVQAMAQTADDARSYTYSGIVFDEWAFQPLSRDGYSAAKPTIDKGRCVGITTPGALGFTCDLYAGKSFAEVGA